jgi:hypothetical protein
LSYPLLIDNASYTSDNGITHSDGNVSKPFHAFIVHVNIRQNGVKLWRPVCSTSITVHSCRRILLEPGAAKRCYDVLLKHSNRFLPEYYSQKDRSKMTVNVSVRHVMAQFDGTNFTMLSDKNENASRYPASTLCPEESTYDIRSVLREFCANDELNRVSPIIFDVDPTTEKRVFRRCCCWFCPWQ